MNIEECFRHIPNRLTPDMKIFAHDVVFKHYIFYSREGKQQHCYCTHCRSYFTETRLRHKQPITCPHCGVICTARSNGMGRKHLIDEAYFVYYLKSSVDPQCITAVGTYAVRDYSRDVRTVETKFIDQDMFVFAPGIGGVAFHRYAYYSKARTMEGSKLIMAGAVKCQWFRDHNANIHCTHSRDSIAQAVKDTPYQYSTWEKYSHFDMVEFFDLASKYACIEYLTKLGFKHLVQDKLEGERTYSAVNWRGKTPLAVLGLTKQELNDIRKNDIDMMFIDLKILKLGRKDGSNLTPAEAVDIAGHWGYMLDVWQKLKRHGNLRKMHSYFAKQLTKGKIKKYLDCLHLWRDYLNDCVELGMDLSRETIVFPRNLHRAHQNTIKLVKHKTDEILDRKIGVRSENLSGMYFEHNGLLIRPAASTGEIIAEGVYLKHCIGGYCGGYARGDYDLFFIRKVEEPEDPFYSIEVRRGELMQCYGYNHATATPEVAEFLEVFMDVKYGKQSRKEAAI